MSKEYNTKRRSEPSTHIMFYIIVSLLFMLLSTRKPTQKNNPKILALRNTRKRKHTYTNKYGQPKIIKWVGGWREALTSSVYIAILSYMFKLLFLITFYPTMLLSYMCYKNVIYDIGTKFLFLQ